eukprot:9968042-Lingulodinium_polyedra.AAC.1
MRLHSAAEDRNAANIGRLPVNIKEGRGGRPAGQTPIATLRHAARRSAAPPPYDGTCPWSAPMSASGARKTKTR